MSQTNRHTKEHPAAGGKWLLRNGPCIAHLAGFVTCCSVGFYLSVCCTWAVNRIFVYICFYHNFAKIYGSYICHNVKSLTP
jgi:hypothetical protein